MRQIPSDATSISGSSVAQRDAFGAAWERLIALRQPARPQWWPVKAHNKELLADAEAHGNFFSSKRALARSLNHTNLIHIYTFVRGKDSFTTS